MVIQNRFLQIKKLLALKAFLDFGVGDGDHGRSAMGAQCGLAAGLQLGHQGLGGLDGEFVVKFDRRLAGRAGDKLQGDRKFILLIAQELMEHPRKDFGDVAGGQVGGEGVDHNGGAAQGLQIKADLLKDLAVPH